MAEEIESMPTSPPEAVDLDKFRKVVRSCIERVRQAEAVAE